MINSIDNDLGQTIVNPKSTKKINEDNTNNV